MLNLWIDDIRLPPDGWYWAKNSMEAIDWLTYNQPTMISFDHDLGGDDTAIKVIDYIEKRAYNGTIERFSWAVHSANPVGRRNIISAMTSVERFWDKNRGQ